MRQVRAAAEQREHGAGLTSGAASDIEKCEQLVGRAALEPFRDVVGDRQRGTFELISNARPQPWWGIVEEIVGPVVQVRGGLPHGQVFKSLVGGHDSDWTP